MRASAGIIEPRSYCEYPGSSLPCVVSFPSNNALEFNVYNIKYPAICSEHKGHQLSFYGFLEAFFLFLPRLPTASIYIIKIRFEHFKEQLPAVAAKFTARR